MLSAIDGCKLFSAMAKALGAAIIKATNKLGYDQMKPEQQTLVEQFVSGRDVFGIYWIWGKLVLWLPTFRV